MLSPRCGVDTEGVVGENVAPIFTRAGGVPERPKGPDCKSDGSAFVGSNPTPSTNNRHDNFMKMSGIGGYCSVAEPQPSKLMTRVRFPLPAPACAKRGAAWVGAHIAQAVEHFLGKEEVIGSNPIVSTNGSMSPGRTLGLRRGVLQYMDGNE